MLQSTQTSSPDELIQKVLDNSKKSVRERLQHQNQLSLQLPSRRECINLVSTFHITREEWCAISKVFHLPSSLNSTNLNKEKEEIIEQLGQPVPTPGNRGFQFNIKDYLRWYIAHKDGRHLFDKMIQEKRLFQMKISADSAIYTRKKRRKGMITGWEWLDDPHSAPKSPDRFHELCVYVGSDDHSIVKIELENIMTDIRDLNLNGLDVDTVHIDFEIFLTLDMEAFCIVSGLYHCSHPRDQLTNVAGANVPRKNWQTSLLKAIHSEMLKK